MPELTVMTWNVENLFPPGVDGGPASQAAYEAKLVALAAVIDGVTPDVLALQEIGDPTVLADLDNACSTDLSWRLTGVADHRHIRVALLSAHPLGHHRDITTVPDGILAFQYRDVGFDTPTTRTTSRGILSATVTIAGVTVTVLTAHFKSKLISYDRPDQEDAAFAPRDEGERLRNTGFAINRRTAEAMTARNALNELLTKPGDAIGDGDGVGRDLPVVFCGDLNDEPLAATTQIIQGPGGSEIDLTPRSGFQTSDQGDGWRMWNLYPLLPTGGLDYTRKYRGRGELIDHIFASHRLVNPKNLPAVRIVAVDPLPSMGDAPPPHPSAPSDHAPIVATFQL